MKNIFLQVKTDSIVSEAISNTGSISFSIWIWIVLVEFAIIVFLFLKLSKRRSNLKFGDLSKDKIQNAKNSDIDMDNLMNSINGSKVLYKELSRACHPDRFVNSDKLKVAEEIFQEISKNKRNFQKMTELKERAVAELNINFK